MSCLRPFVHSGEFASSRFAFPADSYLDGVWAMKSVLLSVGICTFTILGLLACGANRGHNFSSSSYETVNNPTVGVTQNNAFYVRLYDQGFYPFYMNQSTAFGTECSIASGLSSQDIV